MSEPLIFDMGKFPAVLPLDRHYCKNHMWCQATGPGILRFGFSSYAIRLMQDVYFLDWSVNLGDSITQKQRIGNIETSKAVSDLYAPLSGVLSAWNEAVLQDPSLINTDGYGAGWLFELRAVAEGVLSPMEYQAYLQANWESTQRILKGQMHQDSD